MRLRDFIEAEGLTLERFADIVGRHVSTISRIAAGKHVPSPELTRRIFQATGGKVGPADFYDFSQAALPADPAELPEVA